jgi:hypothetical protein
MAKQRRIWMKAPPKKLKPRVPDALKSDITEKANTLIEAKLKPRKLELDKSAKEHGYNYVIDMYTTWWRNYFYFCAKYHCPSPNAISENFEVRYARLEYVGDRRFNLSYMRHTGQWCEVYPGLPLDDCFETIEEEQLFWP